MFHTVLTKYLHYKNVTYQFSRGQEMRCELALQISKQLHVHRTYFFPAGAGLIACSNRTSDSM